MRYKKGEEERFEGDWQDGLRSGYGMLFYRNGDFYCGQFKNGVKEGEGHLVLSEGK